MEIQTNFSLKKYNSFNINAIAENYVSVKSIEDLTKALNLKGKKIGNIVDFIGIKFGDSDEDE